jgi:hypothetical protein
MCTIAYKRPQYIEEISELFPPLSIDDSRPLTLLSLSEQSLLNQSYIASASRFQKAERLCHCFFILSDTGIPPRP